MSEAAIIGIIGAYVLLALLLLSLNIASLWRWWIKAGAIVLTMLVFIGSYVAITMLLGWPTGGELPKRFSVISTRIVEPNNIQEEDGHVYLWVEEIDQNQVVISQPRAFEVPYSVKLSSEVVMAQKQLDDGEAVMGEFETEKARDGQRKAELNQDADKASPPSGSKVQGQSTGESGAFDESIADALSFSEMPPVILPEKTPEQ